MDLHNFDEADFDGRIPLAAVIQSQDGALYGTTLSGGSSGQGTVCRINPDGTGYSVIYSFGVGDGQVEASLAQGTDGQLYGTSRSDGVGSVFKLKTNGADFTILHVFNAGDGQDPSGNLVEGHDGSLYGTTRQSGGTNGFGTKFRLQGDGTGFATLHNFNANGSDG